MHTLSWKKLENWKQSKFLQNHCKAVTFEFCLVVAKNGLQMHWKNSGMHPFDYRGGSTFKWWDWLLSVVAIRDRNWLLGKNVHHFHWFDIDLGSKSCCLQPYNRSQSLYKLTYPQIELEKLISKNMEADAEWEEPKNLMEVRWIALFPASFSVSYFLLTLLFPPFFTHSAVFSAFHEAFFNSSH